MNKVKELHDQAMDLAEIAMVAKIRGDFEKSEELFFQAYKKETESAELMPYESSSEPTRSILYRSAASLAMICGDLQNAERLAAAGLAGFPPEEIADELRVILEEVNFTRHLDIRGIFLKSNEEIQMSLAGDAISAGIALIEEFTGRVEDFKKLFYRTIERMSGKPYREGGINSIIQYYPLFISVPRTGSFAVTLKVGYPRELLLPFLDYSTEFLKPAKIINEILDCLELFNDNKEDGLHNKIPENVYYRNFIGIAKKIAPDGDNINLVGFTTIKEGNERKVGLTRTRSQINLASESQIKDQEVKEVTGRLYFANADNQTIRLKDRDENSYSVIVPEGMLSDIVKPLWEDMVTVIGFSEDDRDNRIRLIDIKPASEEKI